jgi:hypothetical protein
MRKTPDRDIHAKKGAHPKAGTLQRKIRIRAEKDVRRWLRKTKQTSRGLMNSGRKEEGIHPDIHREPTPDNRHDDGHDHKPCSTFVHIH